MILAYVRVITRIDLHFSIAIRVTALAFLISTLTAMADSADAKYETITRRLQEVLGADAIKAILAEGRSPKCYFGTIPSDCYCSYNLFTARDCTHWKTYGHIHSNSSNLNSLTAHIGYFVPLTKIADFLKADVEV